MVDIKTTNLQLPLPNPGNTLDVDVVRIASSLTMLDTAVANLTPATVVMPTIRPSLLLDFANSKTLDNRITFTRASTGTYTGYDGLIKSAATNAPRFDFDPTTGECKGLLIEEARTNLLTYSEQFDNAAWTKIGSTITANATTAPDGTLTADKLIESTANTAHYMDYMSIVTLTNVNLTFSFYFKVAEKTNQFYVQIYNSVASDSISLRIDLQLKTLVTLSQGTATVTAANIVNIGNDWFRASITVIPSSANSGSLYTVRFAFLKNDNSNFTYTGDGTSGIYIWGAQLEVGAFPTSYIPTTSAQATRAADVAVMTGTNFSSWYRQDEGTVVTNVSVTQSVADSNILSIDDGTYNNRIALYIGGSGTVYNPFIVTNASVIAVLTQSAAYSPITNNLLATAYKLNDFSAVLTGHTPVTDTSGTPPVVSLMNIGANSAGSVKLNGTIANLSFYPKRLTNAELQAISTQ